MTQFEKELLKVLKSIQKELYTMNRNKEQSSVVNTAILPNFLSYPITFDDNADSADRSR